MGRPLPGYRIVLLDVDGHPADEGEICIDLTEPPQGLMLGYEGDDGKTADAMRGGYYHTGDIALRDADGYFFYVGRNDDVFKASDYRISPFELESVMIEHEAVLEAAVVPSPDALRLSVPKAYIALRAGFAPDRATASAIFRYSREKLAAVFKGFMEALSPQQAVDREPPYSRAQLLIAVRMEQPIPPVPMTPLPDEGVQ